ncbi:MAG: hypothetical protein ACKN9U_08325, partial [Pirellulaceae bacterium]
KPSVGSSGMTVAWENEPLVFIVLVVLLHEMVLLLEEKRWDTGVSRTSTARRGARSKRNRSNDPRKSPKNPIGLMEMLEFLSR